MRHFRRWCGWLVMGFLVTVVAVAAQADCPTIVNDALTAIGNNCANLDRNSACYGNDRVDSTFFSAQQPGFFTRPADRTLLPILQTIKTSGFNVNSGQFGVAVLNVQANVPEVIPGQGVLFLLMGDMQMTNGVDPGLASSPIPPAPVTTQIATALYSLPALTASVRASLPAGAVVNIDGSNAPGDWLRVVDPTGIAWVQRSTLVPESIPNPLPNVGEGSRMPMQAFYFYTGSVGDPRCKEAESTIAIQTPEAVTITLGMNGVDIRVGSMVTLTDTSLTVHRGHVTTSTGQDVFANQSIDFQMDENGNIINPGNPRPITDDEFNRGERAQDGMNIVSDANGWDEQQITPRDETPPTGDLIHTVAAGDTLFNIARRYNASMPDIISVNGLTACHLSPGQQLRIPNAGSGFVGLVQNPCQPNDPVAPPAPPQPPVNDGICSGFHILSGGAALISTFSWTAVSSADQYKINFYGSDGGYVTSIIVNAPATKIDINMGDIGTGPSFQWEVEALKSGQRLCNTGRTAMQPHPGDRQAFTPVPEQPFVASRKCVSSNQAAVNWDHAADGATVTVFGADSYLGPDFNQSFPNARQGNTTASVPSQLVLIQVFSDAGDFMNLPGCP